MKRFIFTVATLTLAFTPLATHAASLTTKGSTQATIHGFTYAEFAWDKQTTGLPDLSNMPEPDPNSSAKYNTPLYKSTYDEVNSQAESWLTRLYFGFKNSDAGVKGLIVGDFKGKSDDGNRGSFRMRQAWVEHDLNNFKIRIGKAYILEEIFSSISLASIKPAGFQDIKMKRVPLVRVSKAINLEKASISFALAFQSGNKLAVSSGKDTKNNALFVDRYTIPYPAARVVATFDTGFGAPTEVYTWGVVIPVYVSNKAFVKDGAVYTLDNTTGKIKPDSTHKVAEGSLVSDKSEVSYAFGVGLRLPVYTFKLGFNYHHTDGATGYSGLTDFEPASYYLSKNGGIEKTSTNTFNINVVFKPTRSISFGGEYDQVKFDNNIFPSDPKVETLIGNVKIKTTKVTMLGIEWRHIKAKNFDVVGAGDDEFSGDQIYAIYKYLF